MSSTPISPTEVFDLDTVVLPSEVTSGLVPAQIDLIKENTIEINGELRIAGESIRTIAAKLYEIKENIVKPGKWKAFLDSGAIACSPRYATDLVNAHSNWLAGYAGDPRLLAGMTARTASALGGKNVKEKDRQRVFKAIEENGIQTEAQVRSILNYNKKVISNIKKYDPDDRIGQLVKEKAQLQRRVKELLAENKKLRELVAQGTLPGDIN